MHPDLRVKPVYPSDEVDEQLPWERMGNLVFDLFAWTEAAKVIGRSGERYGVHFHSAGIFVTAIRINEVEAWKLHFRIDRHQWWNADPRALVEELEAGIMREWDALTSRKRT